jgi:two-component system heavy metal sensor histidine kinase CusS
MDGAWFVPLQAGKSGGFVFEDESALEGWAGLLLGGVMRPRSLKAKLLLGVSLSMLVLIAVGGVVNYLLFRAYLYEELDHALLDKLRFLRASCAQRNGEVVFDLAGPVWARVQDEHDPEYFQVWRVGRGETLHRSWSEPPGDLPKIGEGSMEPVYSHVVLPLGVVGRAAGQMFYPEMGEEGGRRIAVTITVAHDSKRISVALIEQRRILVALALAASAVILLLIYLIVRRNLKPLTELSRQIEAIPAGSRGSRFELAEAPEELDPVVTRLNALMDRVEAALENERQFTANAAHELRNPLAGMRSQLELALGKARSEEEYREALGGVLKVEKRLEALVENLLLLTRLQSGQEGFVMDEVSICDLLRHCWKPYFEGAEEKELQVALRCDAGITGLRTSEDMLEVVLRNLFDNAVSYTGHGGRIDIGVEGGDEAVEIRVANTNPDLTEEDLEKMFGRFWRASRAREGDHLHAGIGLALTEKVVGVLGGDLRAGLEGEGMLVMTVRLPRG